MVDVFFSFLYRDRNIFRLGTQKGLLYVKIEISNQYFGLTYGIPGYQAQLLFGLMQLLVEHKHSRQGKQSISVNGDKPWSQLRPNLYFQRWVRASKKILKKFPRLELSSNLILPCTYPFLKINIVSSHECPLFIYEKPSVFRPF